MSAFTLYPHQTAAAAQAAQVLLSHGLVYIMGEPRVGKSLTALQTIENVREALLNDPTRPDKSRYQLKSLVLTKKAAIEGWAKYSQHFSFDCVNYEKLSKLCADDYYFIIIDEAHNFGAFPRLTQRTKIAREFCAKKPLIFLSGTPCIESANSLYSQLSLSTCSPFRNFKNGYEFFAYYGISDKRYIAGNYIESYKLCRKDDIFAQTDPISVKITFESAGLSYKNTDKPIIISNRDSAKIKELSSVAIKTEFLTNSYIIDYYPSGKHYIHADPLPTDPALENASAILQCTHRICGGFYNDFKLPQPKLEWLKRFVAEHEGEKIAVMAYFKQEQDDLGKLFKDRQNVVIYSSTRYCEGIDLSGYDHYILYSFGYSGAKFVQLRDRIININKLDRETRVIIPLLEDCVDLMVYNRVSQKLDFNSGMLRDFG